MEIPELPRQATIEDLYELDQKAEIIDGAIVLMNAAGFLRHRAGLNITFSLRFIGEGRRRG